MINTVIARSLALVTNVKVRKVIVYYSTRCFSLSHWGSKQRPLSFPMTQTATETV